MEANQAPTAGQYVWKVRDAGPEDDTTLGEETNSTDVVDGSRLDTYDGTDEDNQDVIVDLTRDGSVL